MDEILIEEKKYISSKRAASVTGYAKDYVGQLCREGRVPARLVGRSWYVLESAINDHRFGNEMPKESPAIKKQEAPSRNALSTMWESPRYEAVTQDALPTTGGESGAEDKSHAPEPVRENTSDINAAWDEWLSRAAEMKSTLSPSVADEQAEIEDSPAAPEPVLETGLEPELERQEQEANVPILAIHSEYEYAAEPRGTVQPAVEVQPVATVQESAYERKVRPRRASFFMRAAMTLGIVISIAAAATAVIGSGYFDTYAVSLDRVQLISGVLMYNK